MSTTPIGAIECADCPHPSAEHSRHVGCVAAVEWEEENGRPTDFCACSTRGTLEDSEDAVNDALSGGRIVDWMVATPGDDWAVTHTVWLFSGHQDIREVSLGW